SSVVVVSSPAVCVTMLDGDTSGTAATVCGPAWPSIAVSGMASPCESASIVSAAAGAVWSAASSVSRTLAVLERKPTTALLASSGPNPGIEPGWLKSQAYSDGPT